QRLGCQKACVLPENPASYRVVRTKSYLFNKAVTLLSVSAGSKSGERAYGSRRCPACKGPEKAF
ncbi:hypothetical protein E7X13_25415, partial [Klebsiella pneumoniae]|nr:hypothetical protein [Klebsiella pneumoniae]